MLYNRRGPKTCPGRAVLRSVEPLLSLKGPLGPSSLTDHLSSVDFFHATFALGKAKFLVSALCFDHRRIEVVPLVPFLPQGLGLGVSRLHAGKELVVRSLHEGVAYQRYNLQQ